MYANILVAIDGSLSSLNALRQTFQITQSGITVVCVAPPYEGDLEILDLGLLKTDLHALLRAPCDKALEAAEQTARQAAASVRILCEVGRPHEGILDVAQASDCDLIVMGKKGLGKIEWALMGSVTARVIGYSPIDVLVIPQDSAVGWKRILLATDGSEYSKNATIRAMMLARAYGGELKVVSASDVASELQAKAPEIGEKLSERARYCVIDVLQQAAGMDVAPECLVREGRAYDAILSVAGEQNVDLIVVGSHGRTGLKRLLMGSVTERVIGHSSCPVLVVKR